MWGVFNALNPLSPIPLSFDTPLRGTPYFAKATKGMKAMEDTQDERKKKAQIILNRIPVE